MRRRPQKVLVLRRLQSLALRRQFAGYYVGYTLCGLIGGLVLAAVAFLLFLVLCDVWALPTLQATHAPCWCLWLSRLVFCQFMVP